MITEVGTTIAQAAALIVAAIIAGIFGLQKMLKGWNESVTETSVMKTMHEELNRMSAQNKILAEELGKFQLEVMKLNNQLSNLTIENNRLHGEVIRLTEEVARLQSVIGNLMHGGAAITTDDSPVL